MWPFGASSYFHYNTCVRRDQSGLYSKKAFHGMGTGMGIGVCFTGPRGRADARLSVRKFPHREASFVADWRTQDWAKPEDYIRRYKIAYLCRRWSGTGCIILLIYVAATTRACKRTALHAVRLAAPSCKVRTVRAKVSQGDRVRREYAWSYSSCAMVGFCVGCRACVGGVAVYNIIRGLAVVGKLWRSV